MNAVDLMNGKIVHDGHMITASGVVVDLRDPDPDMILVEDIAHGLANNCRWNGHTRYYWSVAQHCCMMHDMAPAREELKYLFHDAEEAYWGDIIKPLKNVLKELCPEIVVMMDRMRELIYEKFCIDSPDKGVKESDTHLLKWEFENVVEDGMCVCFWSPDNSKIEWLKRYKAIRG